MSGIYTLLKVAKEINVGKDTIVEFLKTKGHIIDPRPTAKLTEEQNQLVMAEFASEAQVKAEAQQMKVDKPRNSQILASELAPKNRPNILEEEERQVLIKNADVLIREEEQQKATKKKAAAKIETPKEVPAEIITKAPGAVAIEEPKKSEEKSTKPKLGIKLMDKIDLDKVREDPIRADRTPKKKKAEPAKPVVVDVKEEEKPKSKKKKVEEVTAETTPPVEIKKIGKTEAKETPPDADPEIEKKVMTTQYKTLGGIKLMGKIELPVEKVPEPKKKPDVAATAASNEEKKKRKRKRIGGEKVSIQQFGTAAPGAKPGDRPAWNNDKKEISAKEVQDKLKATLARINPGSRKPNLGDVRSKLRKQKRSNMADRREEDRVEQELQSMVLKVTEFLSASELAKMMNVQVTQIIQACFTLGMMVSINQRLDAETISIVADEFGYTIEFVSAEIQEEVKEEEDDPADLIPRPPIVTVMGHVDHGKTSLLDYIRSSTVVAGEAGGITQHIGAYEVTLQNGKQITFLDTPGHEAFTAMRARGAKMTDIVIIVIAADDSVMPQTKEAISHSQAAGVPIVFALNKVDKDGANPDRIREQLSAMNILVEEWGGKFQSQEISAKKGMGIEQLLEKVLIEAEMLDLKANPNKRAVGSIIEASLDKGRGIIATTMIQAGTLRVGDPILAGIHAGKVKAMFNERNQKIMSAGPSTPVSILGFQGAPQAGDRFIVAASEAESKDIANKRSQLMREQGLRTHKHITLDEIGRRLAIGNFKELNLIVKGDVDGSVEALSDSLLKISSTEIQVNVMHKAVGQISETDVMLASASDAIIIGFNVRPSIQARKLAEAEDIDIRLYSIIYNAIEEVKAAMEGMLAPTLEEKITCNVEVRDIFKVPKAGTIAGCMVTEGKVTRNTKIRVIRDGVVMHTGDISSLKRFKDDVKEVLTGYDCGISINKFDAIEIGDVIEGYEEVEVKRKLV